MKAHKPWANTQILKLWNDQLPNFTSHWTKIHTKFSGVFDDKSDSDSDDKKTLAEINARNELINPYWIESPDLKNGPMGQLDKTEELFFKVCILLFAAVFCAI